MLAAGQHAELDRRDAPEAETDRIGLDGGLAPGNRAPVGVEPDRHHALDLAGAEDPGDRPGSRVGGCVQHRDDPRAGGHLRQVGARARDHDAPAGRHVRARRVDAGQGPARQRHRAIVSARGEHHDAGADQLGAVVLPDGERARLEDAPDDGARMQDDAIGGAAGGGILVVHVDGGAGSRQLGGGRHPGGARAHHRRLDDDGCHQ